MTDGTQLDLALEPTTVADSEDSITSEALGEVARKPGENLREIVKKFVERLGDPSKYEYRGEVNDLGAPLGKCTCDHPIRYEFYIHGPNNQTAVVGSECINNFQAYNPALYEALTKAKEELFLRIKEEIRQAREAQYAKEADEARKPWEEATRVATIFLQNYREKFFRENPSRCLCWLPYALYTLDSKIRKGAPRYKRTKTYINFYKRDTEEIYRLLEEGKKGN